MPRNLRTSQNNDQAGPGRISPSQPHNRTATGYEIKPDVLADRESTHPDLLSFYVPTPPLPAAHTRLPRRDDSSGSRRMARNDPDQETMRPQPTPVQNPQQPSYSSSSTLHDGGPDGDVGPFAKKFKAKSENEHLDAKYTLTSRQHPHDIPPPQPPYDAQSVPRLKQPNKVSFAADTKYRDEKNFDTEAQTAAGRDDEDDFEDVDMDGEPNYCEINDRDGRRKGIIANLMEFYGVTPGMNGLPYSRSRAYEGVGKSEERVPFGRRNSNASDSDTYSELDPDDPRVTKVTKRCLDDYEDERRNALRQMDYRQRRKELQRIRIEFNVTCEFY